jgi:predicted transcriptional regulator
MTSHVCHYLIMRTAKTVSITLPPDLLVKAQQLADREHRTMSELFREALRRYMVADTQWEGVLERARATGARLGIRTEEDVERLSDEYRSNRKR